MANKVYRINKNWEFQNVYRKGKNTSSQFFGINYLPNKFGFCRFGIVVSKKTARRAVDRNLLKRRIREILQDLFKTQQGSYDVVISARPIAREADFQKIKNELTETLKKARLIG